MHNLVALASDELTDGSISNGTFALCTAVSLAVGAVIAFSFCFRQKKTKSFATTVALLPVVVQAIIMLVNGNIGTGVAVAGAFGLVRFRSIQGNAKDILGIFLAMGVGIATGTGHLALAFIVTGVVCAASAFYTFIPFGDDDASQKVLTITIPESLDYTEIFDDIFDRFTRCATLESVKTTNMGSLFKLSYEITLKKGAKEKELIDELRVRNGNLEIVCSRKMMAPSQL